MPAIDVYVPEDLLPIGEERTLAAALTAALLEAEGAPMADPTSRTPRPTSTSCRLPPCTRPEPTGPGR